MDYAQHFRPNETPQSEPADTRQVPNSAGGYAFAIDKWQRLERFLVLGCEGGTYYTSERQLSRENAKCVIECLTEDGARAVETIAALSESGRAPKNDPAVFALALAAAHESPATRARALEALPRVCRIGTHLFQFAEAVNAFRGWGRQLRRAIGNWYTLRKPDDLAYQALKYQQRNGWSHKDLLALAHLEPNEPSAPVYRWIVAGADNLGPRTVKGPRGSVAVERTWPAVGELPKLLAAYEELKATKDPARVVALIREHRLTHEMIPGDWKALPDVWEALSACMPIGALIRNLAKLTATGVIAPLSDRAKALAARLQDREQLRKGRVHPIALLAALQVYRQGHGEKGKLTWSPVPQIVDALDAAFYESFQLIEPTGKATLLALDVSGSMDMGSIAGMPGITPRMAAAAMAMVTIRAEKNWHVLGFSHRLVDVPITPRQRLDDVMATMRSIPMGGTDCSLPMLWALQERAKVDAFCIYTDSETWHGHIHPHEAVRRYRQHHAAAKLAVFGFTATEFTIADPNDAGMMDFVGLDSAAPSLLADWIRG